MTQHRGYYCPHCGVRYVAHACNPGIRRLPCRHNFNDAFYTYQWDYSKGYQRFKVANERHGILFDVRYVDGDGLKEAIEEYVFWLEYQVEHDNIYLFVKNKSVVQVFQEACDNAGGKGWDFPPEWRWKELAAARQLALEHQRPKGG